MHYFNELHGILNDHFKWNKARMSCFILMITALIFSRSSNLVKLSALFMTDASQASSYRRIQRFLSDFSIDYTQLARFIFHLFEFKRVRLTLDRTNWKWGKKTSIF
jgi:hypothetical protein